MDKPIITIRDFTEEDIVAQDLYFKNASDEFLFNMGVEVSLARNFPSSSRVRPLLAIPIKERSVHNFAFDVDGQLVGMCVVKKIQVGEKAEVHGHIFNLENRHQGYGQRIFWQMMKKIFETYEVKILICEPCVTNLAPNGLLQKMGLKVTAQLNKPAEGILRQYTANHYQITKEFFRRQL